MNKTIYILWFQGFENAPDVVKYCVSSWKYYNPDWNIILIDYINLRNYVTLEDHIDISENQIEKCHLSDIIRCIIFQNIWDNVPKYPATGIGPHYIIKDDFFNIVTEKFKADITNKITPLFTPMKI